MDLETLLSYSWGSMLPEFIILGTATLLTLIDLFMGDKTSRKPLAYLGLAGVIAAFIALTMQIGDPVSIILNETYRLDSFAIAFKLILLAGTGLVLLLAVNHNDRGEMDDHGEFYYLFLTALLGAMMMASSADMITLFIGLELVSLSSYVLVGIRKRNKNANEAAMKYILNGGIATAITLFGMSYIYGLTGYTNLFLIHDSLQYGMAVANQDILLIAIIITFIGLAFKIAAAPFHMWAPDVYQGAPTPVTAFLSVVSKTAGFIMLWRLVLIVIDVLDVEYQQYIENMLIILAGLTMVVGNTIALKQTNIKRMFAYSSIAHAGYLLVPFFAGVDTMVTLWFYLVVYLFMNIGAFTIIQIVSEKERTAEITAFGGLYKRAPLLASLMGLFLISLAGIPFTAGFMGKIWIIFGALSEELYILVAVMITTTVISYVYYFRVMMQMFFRTPFSEGKVSAPVTMLIVAFICAAGTLILGIMPGLGIDFFENNFYMIDLFVE
ncbi:NADH-quinone oxidoreductase subunit N [Lottiidibacillus patelloidae]|uniref:NADH-quinone oxidoreductase subunit N n=1 Tax=Lottiidibacillus patelloidae TaxID=2670334 RepID=A0A263BRN4_9BACI|nr:NADH-quinone oxidoreductase subunit NuoN [Lottiidibacillus patelloidae]OZM56370.1 NADH-quinone oxidoreductase subunit N [Lottiidibacillus patelloidae]